MTSTAKVKADATRTDSPEYSFSGTKVASDMKPGVVVTTGKKRIVSPFKNISNTTQNSPSSSGHSCTIHEG